MQLQSAHRSIHCQVDGGGSAAIDARLVVAEALTISLLGLAVGLGGAFVIFNVMEFDAGGFVPGLSVTPRTTAIAASIALIIAVASGVVPAWQSARLRVVDALRYVA